MSAISENNTKIDFDLSSMSENNTKIDLNLSSIPENSTNVKSDLSAAYNINTTYDIQPQNNLKNLSHLVVDKKNKIIIGFSAPSDKITKIEYKPEPFHQKLAQAFLCHSLLPIQVP